MKPQILLIAGFAIAISLPSPAADGGSYSFIKTNAGKVYTNCRVFKTDPDGVIIAHQNGGAKLLFADLPEDTRQMLGYDAKKEAAYEKGRADDKRKEREEAWKYRREVAKAQAAAYAAEVKRLEVIAVQNLAMGGGYGYGWDGIYGLGYTPGYGFGHGQVNNRFCQPQHFGFNRGRYTLATPANFGSLNVKGRTFFAPPQRAVPLATPAMGPLTPALGGGGR